MQFDQVSTPKIDATESSLHSLNLYLEPPSEEITLLECEELVKERLNVLQVIERLKDRFKFLSPGFKEAYDREVDRIQPLYKQTRALGKIATFRRRDEISHFMLRLACSTSVDLTQRFIARELDLFRIRFQSEPTSRILQFLVENKLKPDEVSDQERHAHREQLINGNRIRSENLEATKFYRLRFNDCRELIRKRSVYLQDGYCFVTSNDMIQFLSQKFRLILSNSMNKQRAQIGQLEEEDRLFPLLLRLVHEGSRSNEPTNASGRVVKPEQVDEFSRVSFPLCMRAIHNRLRSDHHLKHFARQQYGLFLKGAGLSLDSSVAFFRQEFTKNMSIEKFDKSYLYNIRHMFGQEGNRVDHKPLSCPSIILNNPPAVNDCHGCPFRHADTRILEQRLQMMNISKDRVERIIQMAAREHRYDVACTRVFEYTHDMSEGELGRVITNPNEYFHLSRDIKEGKRLKDSMEPTQIMATQSQRFSV